jgi:hypothetical protein
MNIHIRYFLTISLRGNQTLSWEFGVVRVGELICVRGDESGIGRGPRRLRHHSKIICRINSSQRGTLLANRVSIRSFRVVLMGTCSKMT